LAEEAPSPGTEPSDPLLRFTSGGWLKGVARLGAGAVIVGAVLHFSGGEVLDRVLDPALVPALIGGAAVHVAQRYARLRKWAKMIAGAGLAPRPFRYLLRVQFIGMAANQVLPVSEALKIWAVSRNRREAVVATDSIARDTALHSALIGVFGLLGWLAVGGALPGWVAGAALLMIAVPAALLVVLGRWTRTTEHRIAVGHPTVLGWATLETVAQLVVYAIGARAIGITIPFAELLALAPLLFIADLVMLTPSGLGLREALFAVVFGQLSGDPTDAGVAVGLVISAMVFVASIAGGGLALLLPAAPHAGTGDAAP
jgi:hypothetical protein